MPRRGHGVDPMAMRTGRSERIETARRGEHHQAGRRDGHYDGGERDDGERRRLHRHGSGQNDSDDECQQPDGHLGSRFRYFLSARMMPASALPPTQVRGIATASSEMRFGSNRTMPSGPVE